MRSRKRQGEREDRLERLRGVATVQAVHSTSLGVKKRELEQRVCDSTRLLSEGTGTPGGAVRERAEEVMALWAFQTVSRSRRARV